MAGEWCNFITDDKTTSISCTQLGSLRDCRVIITHLVPVSPLVFDCPILGGGGWEPGRAKVITTTSVGGTVNDYYWPNEIFTSGFPAGTYSGTAFAFHIGSHWNGNTVCNTDVGLAAAIKAELVASLGGTYTEFQSANFSVTVSRANLSCGTSLGIGNQIATVTDANCFSGIGGATPSCYKYDLTKSSFIRGAVVELAPSILRVRFIQSMLKTMVYGADCYTPPPSSRPKPADVSISGATTVGFNLALTATNCFNFYDYSVALPSYSVSQGEFPHSCDPFPGGVSTPSTALTITGRVELIYA